jgi:tripartite ATP-independent transporter DctP family solute receptor
MTGIIGRRHVLGGAAAGIVAAAGFASRPARAEGIVLRMSTPATPSDMRSKALEDAFGPAVKGFASYEPHYNATLFQQGTEIAAIARGNLDMSLTSAQELAELIPAWSIFTSGYLMRSAEHQKKVFASDIGKEMFALTEQKLGVKLLTVMYLGRRQLDLRGTKVIKTPADLAGVKLRMPGTEAWLFLGKALGANPLPMAFTEVYTALQTGAIDGQDNPLPTDRDSKFYEVTQQIVLTSHLVDMNFLAFSKKVWDKLTPEQQATVQKAADDAADLGRTRQLALETELEQFFKAKGLKVYEPDIEAFRNHVQKAYLDSKFAKTWPKGMLERVNAVK